MLVPHLLSLQYADKINNSVFITISALIHQVHPKRRNHLEVMWADHSVNIRDAANKEKESMQQQWSYLMKPGHQSYCNG